MEPFSAAVVAVNVLGALVAGGFGVVGILRPAALIHGERPSPGTSFYAYAYGIRAVPLGLATVVALIAGDRAVSASLLVLCGLIQLADGALGVRRRMRGMVIGGGVLAVIHLLSAWWIAVR